MGIIAETFECGDFCQVRFEMQHPDKGGVPFWRNALFKRVFDGGFTVVFGTGEILDIPTAQFDRIRKSR